MNKYPISSLSGVLRWGALGIASSYLILGALWILFSDQLAASVALNEEMLTSISLYKGWGYVLVTAVLLYWLIQRYTVALGASELQLHRVIDALPVFISYVGADRRYHFTNKAYQERYEEQTEGKHIEEILGKPAYQAISKYVDKVLAGEPVSYETELPFQSTELFMDVNYIPDITADGQVKGFFVLAQDKTIQRQSEEEQRLWADAFEGCAHGIAIDDPNTNRIVVCNPAFAKLHRSSVEHIVGSTILSLYAPMDHEHVRRHVQRADQIGHARFEAQMIRRDSYTFPVEMDVVSVLGENGELLHRVVTAQDISERKSVDEKLRESEAKYRTLIEQASDGIFIADPQGRYTDINSSGCSMLGYSRAELLNLTLRDLIDPEDLAAQPLRLKELQEGKTMLVERKLRRKDGSTFIAELSAKMLTNGHYQAIIRDITERKQVEKALQESKERYQIVSELTSDYAYKDRIEADGNIAAEWITESFTRITGYTLEETHAPGFWQQLVHPEDLPILFEHVQNILSGRPDTKEIRIITKGGQVRWLRDYSNPIWDAVQGRAVGLYGAVQDITERKRAEAALQLKDELLRLTSEIAKVGGWEFDPEMGKGTWTDEVARIHDLDPAQVTNVEIGLSFYKSESREKIEQAMKEAIELAKPYDLELEMVTPKGNHKWVRTMGLPIIQDNKVVKVQGIFQDITERKEIEKAVQDAHNDLEREVQERTAALSEANALLQALMDNIPDHIYFKDTQSRFIRNSRSQASLLGLNDPSETVGKTDFDFFPHAAKAYAEEQEIMRSGKPLVDFEEWVVWPDSREMWVSTTKMPLRNAEGRTIGIFGISRDITERKRTEQAIRRLNADLEKQAEQLQTANKELEAFSYSVSHDLRAPLRAIDGYTRILVEDYESILDQEGKRICSVISREARRMGQLIDDLLAFSRLGRKEMYSSLIDMKALAASAFDELLKEENRERIDFAFGDLPRVWGDSSLIRQVWVNLLSNAIKFASKKERAIIEVGSMQTKDEIIFYVRDNGAGFDMEYGNKLFGVFQRLHSESEFSGTGVGLAMVQRIIRRHDGRVWAEGEVEKGATFYFALPRKENIS